MTSGSVDEYETIMKILKEETFWIYGCGRIATKFYQLLLQMNALSHLKGFIVTHPESSSFWGKPVIAAKAAPQNDWIFVAVNVTNICEINSTLDKFHLKKHLWIYFHLFDLIYGMPIQYDVSLATKDLFRSSIAANWMAVCYLAIESHILNNSIGKNLYLKWFDRENTPDIKSYSKDMAYKDWKRFVTWAEECAQHGFTQEFNIKMAQDYKRVMDGSHRVAMAQYFGVDTIKADIYECDEQKDKLFFGPQGYINVAEEHFVQQRYTKRELQIIKDVFDRI